MYPCGANISVPLTQTWTVSATTVTHAHLLLFLRGLQTDGHSSGARTRCRGTLANSCLWLVLTVSDRSKRVKKKKKKEKVCFAFQSVFVCICATESARNLLGIYSAPWPGLACPPTILWSCCWIGRLKMMHIEVFLFLCVGTQKQHCCRLFSLRLCLSASETKFDFPSLTPLVCLHTCLLILPPSITWASLSARK